MREKLSESSQGPPELHRSTGNLLTLLFRIPRGSGLGTYRPDTRSNKLSQGLTNSLIPFILAIARSLEIGLFIFLHSLASLSKEIEFSMKQKKFSPALIVLVGLLVVAVVAISIVVNPPPAMPAALPNPAAAGKPDAQHSDELPKEAMEQKMKQERKAMEKMQQRQHVAGKPDPVNPDAIKVDNSFFREVKPGAAGQAEMESKIVKQREEYKASMAARKKELEALTAKEAK